ncbi:MAG TPA: hypothetical protein VLU46_07875, partial [Thermoanaerobaculia bacterium]|nr:hypothetical protein [Thermoanaerobaculia bacterium]
DGEPSVSLFDPANGRFQRHNLRLETVEAMIDRVKVREHLISERLDSQSQTLVDQSLDVGKRYLPVEAHQDAEEILRHDKILPRSRCEVKKIHPA